MTSESKIGSMSDSNLSKEIFEQLRQRILHWEYSPGQRLTEELLCAEFGVSRSPVREALQMLAERSLIEKQPKLGYRVKQLNQTEIYELYEIRTALECHVMDRVCREGIDADLLQALEAQWTKLLGDLPGLGNFPTSEDEEFHQTFARAIGNQTLQRMLKTIDDRIRFVRSMDISGPARMEATCRDHLGIIAAARNRDSAEAIRLLKSNIESGRNAVESALKEALARAYERYG